MFAIGGKKDQAKAAAKANAPKSASKRDASGAPTRRSNHPPLSMYTDTPAADISLETFEAYALDRMRVLKAIDDGLSRGKKQPEMESLMNEECGKYLKVTDGLPVDTNDKYQVPLSKDEVSHFALRLAYCRTEELRRWFLLNETTLFKHRFSKLDSFAKAAFLQDHAMEYKPISSEEFSSVKSGLSEVLHGMMKRDDADNILATGASGFYSVPFEEVADLVRGRRVFMSQGQAFVPRDQLTSLVVGAFRAGLSKQLAVASRRWAQHVAGDEKERLAPVIVSLSKRYLGRDFGSKGEGDGSVDEITLKDLPSASKISFPLCAKNLFDAVKREHHLRHEGRRQLQLYMKGIGLSLEDAMLFWKTEFCKKIPAEKFE